MEYQGNTELLKLLKTAFLCSRKVPASVVLKCYDWAIAQREAGICIIISFHSQITIGYASKGGKLENLLWRTGRFVERIV